MTPQPRRKRGVILTLQGKQKLLEAIRAFESEHNFGEKYTIEEIRGQTGLDPGTVAKVLDAEEGADRRTLDRFFRTFNLELAETDYRRPPSTQMIEAGGEEDIEASQVPEPTVQNRVDWGEAVDVSIFYGRAEELTALKQWIVGDRCRLVALLGMGGIGKTSLAAKLGEQIQGEFEYVVWRSLKDAPPLKDTLSSLIQFISDQQETEADLPEAVNARITRLVEYLRHDRCLLVLDNAESILQEGQAGVYREGYEGYGELLRRVGEATHQSCLLLTSREKPKELVAIEGASLPVRCWQMRGIGDVDGQEILRIKGLESSGIEDQSSELIHRCAGNPLALKLVATTIQELFDGDIAKFLEEETIAFGEIRVLLDQHFERLSNLERSIMYWLAINREPVSVQELQEDIIPPILKRELLEVLKALAERSLIEKNALYFTQQSVVMEYVTAQLVLRISEELKTKKFSLFNSYALIKATAKDYIRENQFRLLLKPITSLISNQIEKQLGVLLQTLREQVKQQPGYLAGNIINLLCYYKVDLRGYDFTGLAIWQAHLQGKDLSRVNFAHANLKKCVFNQSFGPVVSMAFSPDADLLALADTNGRVHLWRISDDQKALSLREHNRVHSVAFSPDGLTLATASYDRLVRLWCASTGECLQTCVGHTSWVSSVAFSPDGQLLASGSGDKTVKLWRVSTGQCLNNLQGHIERVRSIAFSPDGQLLATAGDDKIIKLWRIATGQCIKNLRGHTDWIWSVVFSPNGKILASGSSDRTMKLWETASGQLMETLQGHINGIGSVTFSPDGELVVSGGSDGTIKLWQISTGQCMRTCIGHASWVWSVAFSPDGLKFASSSRDVTIKLWQVSTGQCIKTLHGYTNSINLIAFLADGKTLASVSNDGAMRFWQVNTGQCLTA